MACRFGRARAGDGRTSTRWSWRGSRRGWSSRRRRSSRGETGSGPDALTPVAWVRRHAPSTVAGGAGQVVSVAQAFAVAGNAPVKDAVLSGVLPVRSAAVVVSEADKLLPLLIEEARPTVLDGRQPSRSGAVGRAGSGREDRRTGEYLGARPRVRPVSDRCARSVRGAPRAIRSGGPLTGRLCRSSLGKVRGTGILPRLGSGDRRPRCPDSCDGNRRVFALCLRALSYQGGGRPHTRSHPELGTHRGVQHDQHARRLRDVRRGCPERPRVGRDVPGDHEYRWEPY